MNEERRGYGFLITGFVIGALIGILYSWIISPVTYTDTSPGTLRSDFKDQYRYMIALAYRANPNLDRAEARISLLGDPDPVQALIAQAQQMRANGSPEDAIQPLAQLSDVLRAIIPTVTITPSPLPPTETSTAILIAPSQDATAFRTAPPTRRPTRTASPTITQTLTITPTLTLTFTPIPSVTPRATRTPTRTPGAPFVLRSRSQICNADQPTLMQITVYDSSGKEAPGIEITIAWGSTSQKIFTGLKPELGNGYADFMMRENVIYSVRVGESGNPLNDLLAPVCASENGSFTGGWKLEFQQP